MKKNFEMGTDTSGVTGELSKSGAYHMEITGQYIAEHLNRREVQRYLGYRGITEIDDATSKLIEECIDELGREITPRYVTREFPLTRDTDGVSFAGMYVKEGQLTRNLTGCERVILFAATVGVAPDVQVRRASLRSMMKTAVIQAASAAMVEELCDIVNTGLRDEAMERGYYVRPRFSPGYGDFPLERQVDFFRELSITREIGVSLSDSLIMTPSKSVTALIGLSRTDRKCLIEGCENCSMSETCEFSRAR